MLKPLPRTLLVLWREQHPRGVEQLTLDFAAEAVVEQRSLV
jgi:hypothetical protein